MAQQVQTLFIDDIDGRTTDGVTTVSFGLDGQGYEMELNPKHAEELRTLLGKYAKYGRKLGSTSARGSRRRRSSSPDVDTTKVRNWAKENGISVKDRGRVPADVVAQYHAATGE